MKSNLFSLIFIITLKEISSNSILDCSILTDEMECNFCNDEENYCHCYWKDNKCEINEEIYKEKLFISNFNLKYNNQNKSDIEKYCGNIPIYLNKDFFFVPKLLENKKYGKKNENIYCKFIIKIETEKSMLKITKAIEFDIPKNENQPEIYMKINSINNFQEFHNISKSQNFEKTDFKFYITLLIKLKNEYNEYPFQLRIIFHQYELIRIYIALITFLIIIIFIIRTVIVVYLNQTKTKRTIEKLMKKRKYKPNMGNYGTTCSICLEDFFIGGREVSITPCKHIFHYTCIHAWLLNDNNIRHTKCPYCNAPILKEENINNDNNNRNNNSGNNNNRNNRNNSNRNMRSVHIV
jgi:hypothetical protein